MLTHMLLDAHRNMLSYQWSTVTILDLCSLALMNHSRWVGLIDDLGNPYTIVALLQSPRDWAFAGEGPYLADNDWDFLHRSGHSIL